MAHGSQNAEVPSAAKPTPAAEGLDPDLATLSSWTLDTLAKEIQAQRQHLADLSDFLQVLQDDAHVHDPAFAAKVLESLRRMEQRLETWEKEFSALLKK